MPGEPADSIARELRVAYSAAAERVDGEFRDRIRRLADSLLDGRVRGRLDSEDVVQSVFKSFFRRQSVDPFPVGDRLELWHLLAEITWRKCRRAATRHLGPRRDAKKEVGPVADTGCPDPTALPPDAEPVMADLVRRLRDILDDAHRAVFDLRLEGYEVAQIANELKVTRRTVERRLAAIREQLKSLVDEES